jgi:RNA polymerase sigma-B factor
MDAPPDRRDPAGMPDRDDPHTEQLVLDHQGLARRLARRYAHGDRQLLEELEQVAALGLVQAACRFEPERGTAFSTFAVPTIVGELRRHFRSARWVVHVPRRLQEDYLTSRNTERAMTSLLGRPPGAAELADQLGWTQERLLEARAAAGALASVSLDAPVSSDGDTQVPLVEHLGDHDAAFEAFEVNEQLEQAMAELPTDAEEAVRLRYAEDLSFDEVAGRIGVSPSRASKLIGGALHELRAGLHAEAA